jgi:hypothetical protein
LIVTFARDFPWLHWCVKAIEKFAFGFAELVIAIPRPDATSVATMIRTYNGGAPVRLYPFDEWEGKGFVHHAALIINADNICPDADYVLHLDADCIVKERITPEDYMEGGKPVLVGAPYEWLIQTFKNPNLLKWKEAVEAAVGGVSRYEFMRRHPAVHHLELYGLTKKAIRAHTGQRATDYFKAAKNDYPQTIAEFPTLGEIAFRQMHDRYHFILQPEDGRPKDKLIQFWSHSPPDKTQDQVWVDDVQMTMNPLEEITRILS